MSAPYHRFENNDSNVIIHPSDRSLPSQSWTYRLISCERKACYILSSIFICIFCMVAMIIAMLFYPQVPEYSICNQNIHWSTILQSIILYKIGVDVEILVSIYNPNRVTVNAKSIVLDFTHQGEKVGKARVKNVQFVNGSVTDMVVKANIFPEVSHAAVMALEYSQGKLILDSKIHFDSSLAFWDVSLLNINTSIDYNEIDANGGVDRKWCKCAPPKP